jgi:hypothetical protein
MRMRILSTARQPTNAEQCARVLQKIDEVRQSTISDLQEWFDVMMHEAEPLVAEIKRRTDPYADPMDTIKFILEDTVRNQLVALTEGYYDIDPGPIEVLDMMKDDARSRVCKPMHISEEFCSDMIERLAGSQFREAQANYVIRGPTNV